MVIDLKILYMLFGIYTVVGILLAVLLPLGMSVLAKYLKQLDVKNVTPVEDKPGMIPLGHART